MVARIMELNNIQIRTDYKPVVDRVNKIEDDGENDRIHKGYQINNIHKTLASFENETIGYIRRKANDQAHRQSQKIIEIKILIKLRESNLIVTKVFFLTF